MKKLITPTILPLLFLVATLSGCGFGNEAEKAEKTVEQFYTLLAEKDYDKAMEMVDEESLAITPYENWKEILVQKETLGKFKGYKKEVGFNTHYNNGVTTVDLNYTCNFSKTKLHEHFTLAKRKEGFKILLYEYNIDKSKLSK